MIEVSLDELLDALVEDQLADELELYEQPLRVMGLDEVRERLLWDRGGVE